MPPNLLCAAACVTILLYLPLHANWRADGSVPKDCDFSQPTVETLVPARVWQQYDRIFTGLGPATESFGPGSWVDRGRLDFETDVHVSVTTSR
jgi:hypothetical protein